MAVKQVQGQRGKPVHSTGEQNNTVLDHTGPQMMLNKTPTSSTAQEKAKAPKPELKRASGPLGMGVCMEEAAGEASQGY